MHRPGILRISGDRVVLDGATIEEVERYHAKTLSLAVEATNRDAADVRARANAEAETAAKDRDTHRANVAEIPDRTEF